jgi:hypothetical protein
LRAKYEKKKNSEKYREIPENTEKYRWYFLYYHHCYDVGLWWLRLDTLCGALVVVL